jgi:hypothetical protein
MYQLESCSSTSVNQDLDLVVFVFGQSLESLVDFLHLEYLSNHALRLHLAGRYSIDYCFEILRCIRDYCTNQQMSNNSGQVNLPAMYLRSPNNMSIMFSLTSRSPHKAMFTIVPRDLIAFRAAYTAD